MGERRWTQSVGIGGLATALALLWFLASRLLLGVVSPVELVVDRSVPLVPLAWFEAGLRTLGGYGKPLLYAVALLAAATIGAALGAPVARLRGPALSRAARVLGGVLLLASGLILLPLLGQGVFGAASPAGPVRTALTYAVAAGIYAATLALPATLARVGPGADPARRRLLLRVAGAGGAVLLLAAGIPIVARVLERLTVTTFSGDAEGMPAPITPVETFYTVSKNALDPRVDAEAWRLRVGGLVDRPFELSLAGLRAFPAREKEHTLQCISNPVGGDLIGNALWRGVPLRDLLERAGVRAGVVDLQLACADGYIESIPLAKALEAGALLAYEMNGAPLTPEHGAPLRLLVPNIYGMKNAKWLTGIEAVGEDIRGYWQQQGWSDVATYQTVSQLRLPLRSAPLTAGRPAEVGGIAFAGSRGVARVEWSADGGATWSAGELLQEPGGKPDVWRLWTGRWTPESPGRARLLVRATDGGDAPQSAEERPTLPDGATGYHTVEVEVVSATGAEGLSGAAPA